mgnify:CR=1 FL=1
MSCSIKDLMTYIEATGKDFDAEVAENFAEMKDWNFEFLILEAIRGTIHYTTDSSTTEAVYQALVNVPEFGPVFQEKINDLVVDEMTNTYRHLVSNWFAKNQK